MGAHEVSPQEAPELHAMIERLCIQADLPKPRVYVVNTPDAQRLRHGPLEEGRGGVRDDGHPRAALPRRARGRHGPRADPHRQPRRGGHDAGRLLRLARLDDRAVRLLLRRQRRRRRRPRDLRDHPRLARRLRDLVLPHAGALALPRVRRRPRRGGHHRPPERAVLGAAEDQRHDGAHPADRPARPRRDERVLHRPRRREELGLQPVLDAPADGEAHRGALSAWRRSCRARRKLRRMGFLDALLGKRKVEGAGDRPAVRDLDGLRGPRRAAGHHDARRRRHRLPAAGDGRLPPDRRGHEGGPVRRPAPRWARRSRPRTTSSATAG